VLNVRWLARGHLSSLPRLGLRAPRSVFASGWTPGRGLTPRTSPGRYCCDTSHQSSLECRLVI